jgi:hypothetical protein
VRAAVAPIHRWLVYVVTLAVLCQAVLAGQFVSGLNNMLGAHGALGGVLELLGLVLVGVAVVHRIAGEPSRIALWGSMALGVALQVQAALGWASLPVATAIHVPLGVCIFAGAVGLTVAIGRTIEEPADDGWQGNPRYPDPTRPR